MPITRTSSHQQVRESTSDLVIASSPESTMRSPSTKRKRDTPPKPKAVVFTEVIEISSDDDEPAPQKPSATMELRSQVKKLKEVGLLHLSPP
ncbi:hypothetical protein C0991_000767 [Blastosporella zonata]|nr:hypothetical protein C0991_000767 [Blastosporella zonata]